MKARRVFDWKTCHAVLVVFLYFGFGLVNLKSEILLDVTGSLDGMAILFNDGQWIGQQWTSTKTLTDVSISAGVNLAGVSGTAWLMNKIGSAATAVNVLDMASFDSPGSGTITFFDNLTLQPGPYFFLLTVDNGLGGWQILTQQTVTADPSVSYGGYIFANSDNAPLDFAFPPASTWQFGGDNLQFLVVGSSASTIPEPSTLPLFTLVFAVFAASIASHHFSRCTVQKNTGR